MVFKVFFDYGCIFSVKYTVITKVKNSDSSYIVAATVLFEKSTTLAAKELLYYLYILNFHKHNISWVAFSLFTALAHRNNATENNLQVLTF